VVTVPLVGGDGGGGTITVNGNQLGSTLLSRRNPWRFVRAHPVSGGLVVKAPEKPDEESFRSTVSLGCAEVRYAVA